MAKKKAAKPQTDRHRPHKMVRIDAELYGQLAALAEREDRTISAVLRRIIRAALIAAAGHIDRDR